MSHREPEILIFRLQQTFKVGLLQPSSVTAYEYYNPGRETQPDLTPQRSGYHISCNYILGLHINRNCPLILVENASQTLNTMWNNEEIVHSKNILNISENNISSRQWKVLYLCRRSPLQSYLHSQRGQGNTHSDLQGQRLPLHRGWGCACVWHTVRCVRFPFCTFYWLIIFQATAASLKPTVQISPAQTEKRLPARAYTTVRRTVTHTLTAMLRLKQSKKPLQQASSTLNPLCFSFPGEGAECQPELLW